MDANAHTPMQIQMDANAHTPKQGQKDVNAQTTIQIQKEVNAQTPKLTQKDTKIKACCEQESWSDGSQPKHKTIRQISLKLNLNEKKYNFS